MSKLQDNVLKKVLLDTFGYDEFRLGQEEIIRAIMEGQDTLAVMPTGAGKSLCYQIPALIMEGICLVVSPLIALMQDQVTVLKRKGVSAEYIASGMPENQVRDIYSRLSQGEIKILYVSPERLKNEWFRGFVGGLDLSFVAIDEAHCISEWGHDFRPSYRLIGEHLRVGKAGTYRVAAFTATATAQVRDDICRVLEMNDPRVFIRGFDRPNLTYTTEICTDKLARIKELVADIDGGSVIIYAGSRKRVEEIYGFLHQEGEKVQIYHAGLADKLREKNQDAFIEGGVKVMVATNAFGMGVDKPDVRLVLHHDMPSTVESYYQEAGRAGRDGKKSNCILLYKRNDERLQEFFINCTYPEKSAVQKIWKVIRAEIKAGRPEKVVKKQSEIATAADSPFATVSNVVSMLERKEVLIASRQPSQASVKFEVPIEDLRDLDRSLSDRQQKECLRAIVKNLPSSAMREFEKLNLIKLAEKVDIDRGLLRGFLGFLSNGGYASVRYDGPIGTYSISQEYEESDRLPLDFKQMELQKQRSLDMMAVILNYIKTSECKKNYILKYFGETPGIPCGKCSGCNGSNSDNNIEHENHKQHILKAVETTGERYGRVMIVAFLRGEKNDRITSSGLWSRKSFGTLSIIGAIEIHSMIDELISDNMLVVSEGQYKTISLGPAAFESMFSNAKGNPKAKSTVNRQSRKTENSDSRKLAKESFYSLSLKSLALAISKIEGVPPAAVISTALAAKFAKIKPIGTHKLDEIGALDNRWVETYKHTIVNITELTSKQRNSSETEDIDYFSLFNQLEAIMRVDPGISLRKLRSDNEIYYPYSMVKAALRDVREKLTK